MTIIEIGPTSLSTTDFFLPSPPVEITREETIVKKRGIQGDLNLTITGANKRSFTITWEVTTNGANTYAGVENYNDIKAFCNKPELYYVKMRNQADTSTVYEGMSYLEISGEQSKYDSQLFNFTLTVIEA